MIRLTPRSKVCMHLITLSVAVIALATGANATPVTYVLNGARFDDGGTASGSFTYDAVTNIYSNVNITTTPGTTRPTGAVYSFVCGQDDPFCTGLSPNSTQVLFLTSNAGNQNGKPSLSFFFTPALQLGVASVNLAGSGSNEVNCGDPSCFLIDPATFRSFTGGQVVAQVSFQTRYTSNLINGGDAVINITNSGASATALLPPGQTTPQNNINGDICVNIYTFAADEQEVACCSCLVTPNALWSASVKTALLNSTLTPSFPNEVVIKLISSAPIVTGGAETCNPATVGAPNSALSDGLLAWGTSTHGVPTATGPTFSIAETPFSQGTLS
jgi:hypothetical protein